MDPSLAELDAVARLAQPYLVSAVRALGVKVLDRAQDAAADQAVDATERVGRRIWRLIAGHSGKHRPEIDAAVHDLSENPDFPDYETVLRIKLVNLLKDDPEFRAQIRDILSEAAPQATYQMTVSQGSAGAQGPSAQAFVINDGPVGVEGDRDR
jgi:hypothetical protein